MTPNISVPRFVIFEGVDGSGKTTLARALANHYRAIVPNTPLYAGSFPGSFPGTLGEWVYRLHHGKATDAPLPNNIAPPALQLLHVAAHVDTILARITPILTQNGCVILDRYWWSTYAYSRTHLSSDQVWHLVNAERVFWDELPRPVAIYLSRSISLKSHEIHPRAHAELDTFYREVIKAERKAEIRVHELTNDGPLEETWAMLLAVLKLPYQEL
jgi:thymidylate kinase